MRMDGRDTRMGCDNTPSFWVQVGAVQQGPELCSAAPGKHQGSVFSPVKAREMGVLKMSSWRGDYCCVHIKLPISDLSYIITEHTVLS